MSREHVINVINIIYDYWWLTLINWLKYYLSGFTIITFFSTPYLILHYTFWKEVTMWNPHWKSGELCSTHLGKGIYKNHLEFCIKGLSILPTYLFIQSYRIKDAYFTVWVVIQICFYFYKILILFLKLFQLCSLEAPKIVSSVPLTYYHDYEVVVIVIPLLSGTKICSRLMLHISCPSLVISYLFKDV